MHQANFRISIAIEDSRSGGMKLLLVEDDIGGMNIEINLGKKMAARQPGFVLPGIDATVSCSKATWLLIKKKSEAQGAKWTQGKTRRGETYWTSKPKITVLEILHSGVLLGKDPKIRLVEGGEKPKLEGNIDDRVSKVLVRDSRQSSVV